MRTPVGAALATFLSLTVNAQEAGLSPDLAAFINDPKHKQATLEIAHRDLQDNEPGCRTAAISLSRVSVLKPMQSVEHQPVTGAWIEHLHVASCGPNKLVNVLSVVSAPGKVEQAALLPGTTRTDPVLQRDAVRYAVIAAGPEPAGCTKGSIVNTKLIGSEGPPDPSLPGSLPPWREEWTLAACGKRSIVTLHFVPDATGTTITTSLRETKQE